MAASIRSALARLRREDCPLIAPLITPLFEELCRDGGYLWRDRVFTPLVALRFFSAPDSTRQHRHQPPASTVRHRLFRIELLRRATSVAIKIITSIVTKAGRRGGPVCAVTCPFDHANLSRRRVELLDVRHPSLSKHFGTPAGQKIGVGYPMCAIMGMLDLASGLFTKTLALPMFTHDQRGVIGLHESLQKGDILAGDREGLALRSRVLFVLSLRLARRARRVRLLPTAPASADRSARTRAMDQAG